MIYRARFSTGAMIERWSMEPLTHAWRVECPPHPPDRVWGDWDHPMHGWADNEADAVLRCYLETAIRYRAGRDIALSEVVPVLPPPDPPPVIGEPLFWPAMIVATAYLLILWAAYS